MNHSREPVLRPIPIAELRPTQVAVGMREVAAKRREWRHRDNKAEWLGAHMIPIVLGRTAAGGDRAYVIDHHHLARALLDEGQTDILTHTVADLRILRRGEFWTFLDNRGWCYPYDERGRRLRFDAIPKRIADLHDDPFRSLAGEVRRRGGFAKETTPFSEFLWADFFRRRLARPLLDRHFDGAIEEAIVLAKSRDASYLPGWCGPHS